MKRLILVGCGAFAREIINWSYDLFKIGKGLPIFGFLDSNQDALKGFTYNLEYLGNIDDYIPNEGDSLLISIGDPQLKKKIVTTLKSKGATFSQLIHPTATIAYTAKLGEGVIVCPQAFVSADAVVGDFVAINGASSIGHDVEVGSFSTLSAHVDLMGWVKIEDCVFFGSGARVLPKVKVKANAKIGAGAIIMRTVAENAVMYAQPAKKL